MNTRRVLLLLAVLAGAACGGEPASQAAVVPVESAAASHDPCGLLTRVEAEQVLGTLTADPYRSKQDTTVADSGGPSCAYATAGGRFFLLTPEWTYGKMALDAERLIGGLVRQVANLPNGADTLEGTWDDVVVGLNGGLVLRKGARALTISYLKSSTDLGGAIELSGPALARLAAVPEPARPTVSSDGCPLPPDVVTKILGMPVRLTPRPVRLVDACSYQLEEDPTVELELSIKPVAVAEMPFDGLHARAKTMLGSANRPDSLTFGNVGWAYGSGSGSEAAVRRGEDVYHAVMSYPLSTTTPGLKDAMVRLVAAMMSMK
jgi:hypothetical protein